MIKTNKQINIFSLLLLACIACSILHFTSAHSADINPQANKEQTKDNQKPTTAIYPQLNQGYSQELNQDIESQNTPLLKPSETNNVGFYRAGEINDKTLCKFVCLCAILPTTIIAGAAVAITYIIYHYKKC